MAVLAVLAGCSDGGTATPARPAGSAATVPSDAATEAGYTPDGSTEITVNTTLRADLEGDIEVREFVDVVATVPVSRYRRSTDGGPAVVAVAASPEVQVIEDPPSTATRCRRCRPPASSARSSRPTTRATSRRRGAARSPSSEPRRTS